MDECGRASLSRQRQASCWVWGLCARMWSGAGWSQRSDTCSIPTRLRVLGRGEGRTLLDGTAERSQKDAGRTRTQPACTGTFCEPSYRASALGCPASTCCTAITPLLSFGSLFSSSRYSVVTEREGPPKHRKLLGTVRLQLQLGGATRSVASGSHNSNH